MQSVIINPGSNISKGTFEQALKNAKKWLDRIQEEFGDVIMSEEENYDGEGRWRFEFVHLITCKVAYLDIHGFTEEECDKFVFYPRTYWQGSSTSDPCPDDWAGNGYKYKYVYYK